MTEEKGAGRVVSKRLDPCITHAAAQFRVVGSGTSRRCESGEIDDDVRTTTCVHNYRCPLGMQVASDQCLRYCVIYHQNGTYGGWESPVPKGSSHDIDRASLCTKHRRLALRPLVSLDALS